MPTHCCILPSLPRKGCLKGTSSRPDPNKRYRMGSQKCWKKGQLHIGTQRWKGLFTWALTLQKSSGAPQIRIPEDHVQFGCDIWYNSSSGTYSDKRHFTHVIYSPWPMSKKKNVFLTFNTLLSKSREAQDFPGGPVVKNLPTNAGDMGSIPGGESPHARRHLSSHTAATACALEPTLHDERSSHSLQPPPWLERRPAHHTWRKPTCSSEDPAQLKIIFIKAKMLSPFLVWVSLWLSPKPQSMFEQGPSAFSMSCYLRRWQQALM